MKQTKYKIKDSDMEKKIEEIDSKQGGRKDYEQFKESERMYAKFTQQTGAVDQEFEKDLERIIDEKMDQGLEDEQILDQIMTGGRSSITNKDIWEMEDSKEAELLEQFRKQGIKPPSFGDNMLFSQDPKETQSFEDFQQKVGKMMYEEDDILMEKWVKEEKEKRQKLYESTKPKRSIEGSQTFGYVKETEDVKQLHKNTVELSKQE